MSDVSTFDLGSSEEEQLVADTFRALFANESPIEVVRRAEPLGFDPAVWASLCGLGAPSMGVAEELGGGGGTIGQLIAAVTELGAHLAPVPLVEHLVAARAFGAAIPADVLDGSAIATLALAPADASGCFGIVPAGAIAQVVVGLRGDELVAVRSAAPGSIGANFACAPIAVRSCDGAESVEVIGDAGAFRRAMAEWEAFMSAVLVGIAQRALDLGLEYVRTRHQFGVPVGSFQSVQHGLATVVPYAEGARLLTGKAAWALDGGGDGVADVAMNEISEPLALARMAFLFAAQAAAISTDKSLHYHGGYGYAEEYDIQLYYRRARGWALAGGSLGTRTRDLADDLFPGGAS